MGETLRLIMWREMRERARTRSYMISTVVLVLLVFGSMFAARFLPDFFETEPQTIGVVADAEARGAVEATAQRLAPETRVRDVPDRASGEAALEAGDLDALLVGQELLFREDPRPALVGIVGEALHSLRLAERAEDLGLTVEQAQQLVQPPDLQVRSLEPVDAEEEDPRTWAVGFGAVLILFIAIMASGNTVLMGVVEEKTSRVVEVVLGAARPAELLGGKVMGIVLLGLAQLLAATAAGVAGFLLVGAEIDLPPIDLGMIPIALVFVVLGLLFYPFAYAAVGSTVSRQEEAANASLPITVALMGAYGLGFTVIINNPDGMVSRLTSIVPPLSPITMPPRVGLTDVPAWEVALSMGLMALATVVMLLAAERIYSAAILRQGARVGLFQAFRSAEKTD